MNKRPGAYSRCSAKKGRCLFEGGSLIVLSFPFNKQYLWYDDNAIGTYKVNYMYVHGTDSVKLVDYILIERSFFINCFLQMHPNKFIINEITGLWRLENSVVVPVIRLSYLQYLEVASALPSMCSVTCYVK